jgi:molecular chaperone IbpA
MLLVAGQKHPDLEGIEVLHRGIATGAFRQTFNLADHMKVSCANLENGLLVVDLKREVPEALKPRRIDVSSQGGRTAVGQDNRPEQIEGSANAA